jgi:hypothetical protein
MIDRATRLRPQPWPAAGSGARRVSAGVLILALAWAGVVTARSGLGSAEPLLSVVALALLVAAAVVVMRASDPLRGSFGSRAHIGVHAMLVIAGFSGAGADWGTDAFVRGDWVPTTLGLFVVAMSPYRPVRELIGFTAVSGTLVGAAALLGGASSGPPPAPLAFALAAVTPTFALAVAAAVYSKDIGEAGAERRRRSEASTSALSGELQGGIVRGVRRMRMASLGSDVSPFLQRLAGSGRITESDRQEARGIADSLRRTLVDVADRSWLDDLTVGRSTEGLPPFSVDDPDHVARRMSRDQRTALRALIGVLPDDTTGVVSTSLGLARGGGRLHGILCVGLHADPTRARRRLAPYLAAMEGAFATLDIDSTRTDLIVRFSYDQT